MIDISKDLIGQAALYAKGHYGGTTRSFDELIRIQAVWADSERYNIDKNHTYLFLCSEFTDLMFKHPNGQNHIRSLLEGCFVPGSGNHGMRWWNEKNPPIIDPDTMVRSMLSEMGVMQVKDVRKNKYIIILPEKLDIHLGPFKSERVKELCKEYERNL